MYEKHIERLGMFRDGIAGAAGEKDIAALDAAIELMRAAEPKDEAAEREHCRATVLAIEPDDELSEAESVQLAADLLLRERAAVKAEREIEIACLRKDVEDWKRRSAVASREARLFSETILRDRAAKSSQNSRRSVRRTCTKNT